MKSWVVISLFCWLFKSFLLVICPLFLWFLISHHGYVRVLSHDQILLHNYVENNF